MRLSQRNYFNQEEGVTLTRDLTSGGTLAKPRSIRDVRQEAGRRSQEVSGGPARGGLLMITAQATA
ncbi:MAG: hypothetical protein ACRDGH_07305, partial [Candidatus Limnocylindria bacterium]